MNKNYFIGKPNENVYRFTTVKWLLDSIVQKRNTLVSPRKWQDPFENALAAQLLYKRPDGSVSPYPFRDRAYGQCWTLVPETDAFWRMYSPQGDGVRLKSTTRTLYETIKSCTSYPSTSCFIGRVRYKSEDKITAMFNDKRWVKRHFQNQGARGHLKTLLLKRVEFKPENEIRLLYFDPHNKDYGDVYHYTIDPSSTFSEITFDPRMEDTLYSTYESVLRSIGFDGEINKSHLYRAPQLTICV